MTEKLLSLPHDFWAVLTAMAPYLLFGFLVAGILSVLVAPETVERHLGASRARGWRTILPVFKAALFGVPLPLCSCGVIPVAASLSRHGATRGATTAFLISTPQTGVDSIFVTYSLLGLPLAIFRPLAALSSGVIGGLLVTLLAPGSAARADTGGRTICTEACCAAPARPGLFPRLRRVLEYGFVILPRDIGRSLLLGLLVAGMISALVPPEFFAGAAGHGLLGMLLMLLIGIPTYVCATGSIPIALALVLKGVSPGAALVFLMSGPATNAATILTVWRTLGRRTALIYLATIAGTAIGSGLLFDGLFPKAGAGLIAQAPHVHGGAGAAGAASLLSVGVHSAAGVILLGVLGFALFPFHRFRRPAAAAATAATAGTPTEPLPAVPAAPASPTAEAGVGKEPEAVVLTVSGMTCSHCAATIRRTLLEQPGIVAAEVSLERAEAVVRGHGLDPEGLARAVEELGYRVTDRRAKGYAAGGSAAGTAVRDAGV